MTSLHIEPTETVNIEAPRKQRPKYVQAIHSMFVWYPKSYPAKERKLLFKLDLVILIYACLSFFVKYLDQSNISNAYVSGMKEDLSLYGNQLNWLNITYFSGYVLGQVPFLLLISRPKLSKYVLPTLELVYGVLTFCQSEIKTVNQLYAVRFFVGLFEAPSFAGVHYALGRFYGNESHLGAPPELFVRAGMWFMFNSIGTMVSGYLQAATYENLNGVLGRSGWRWLFIIDGVITVPIAFLGYAVWPGIPESGKPFYLDQEEYSLVLERAARFKVQKPTKLNRELVERTFKGWRWYVLVFAYICMLMTSYPGSYMNLWLKSTGRYSVPQINTYPTVTNAINIVASYFGTSLAAVYPPWIIFTIASLGPLTGAIILSVWNVSDPAKFVAYYLYGLAGCTSPILYSTVNKILKHDQEQKAIVMGSMMGIGYFVYTWLPLALFPTTAKDTTRAAPQWRIGFPLGVFWSVSLISCFYVVTYLSRREEKQKNKPKNREDIEDEVSTNSSGVNEIHYVVSSTK